MALAIRHSIDMHNLLRLIVGEMVATSL